MFEISKQFYFDAAHFMPHMREGHAYRQMHGHSFHVRIAVRGEPDTQNGWIMDFEALDTLIAEIRNELDHHLLNDIDGLSIPTLENICAWLWRRLSNQLPGLARITVARESVGQSCTLSA
ncbi:MAG: 6-pyruvoyltetrahydropterin/6-carboxytetrahydropterin synthase [Alphaproteobacteria bacterium]|nr:6-pyruvoyltetrahydropterin/6-carboxytetrahydropterin synthase [Alphaproteobacteria bacterium]